MINYGVGITPDRYLIVIFVGALMIKQTKHFIHDFAPFLFILVGYDFLRGFADKINPHIHYLELVPTIDLQQLFYTPLHLHWYDYGASYLYMIHFAVPLILAFFLWLNNRRNFREFMLALSLLSYSALVFFVVYPVAPPWLASQMGFIPSVANIPAVVGTRLPHILDSLIPTFYGLIPQNFVATLPSIHAAYAFLVFLFARKFYPRLGWLMIIYPLVIWLVVIYLGQHYLIDVLLGSIMAYISYLVAHIVVKKFGKELDFL
jgi:membrane-associated phospholipid phosphatase